MVLPVLDWASVARSRDIQSFADVDAFPAVAFIPNLNDESSDAPGAWMEAACGVDVDAGIGDTRGVEVVIVRFLIRRKST